MKSYCYIKLLILFLAVQSFAQNKYVKPDISSLVYESFKFNNYSDQIIVISIINPNDSDEIAHLDNLAKKYQASNVAFIAITDEANDSMVNSLKYQLTHYQYLAEKENERVFNKYQTGVFKIFPLQIITNQEGDVLYEKKGNTKNIQHKISKRLNKLLNAKPTKGFFPIGIKNYLSDSQNGE